MEECYGVGKTQTFSISSNFIVLEVTQKRFSSIYPYIQKHTLTFSSLWDLYREIINFSLLDFYMVILSCQYLFIQAKQSTGGSGVDAANVMISQLRAQKAVKKKSSTAAPPTPGRVSEIYDPVL